MKKLCVAILFFPLFWGSVLATDSVVLDVGMASGKTTSSDDLTAFDHDTSGTSWGIGYQKVLENGLLFGGGYQNFEVSGEKTAPTSQGMRTFKTKLQISGVYGAIGYSLEVTENLFFQPGLRLGIGNNYEVIYSYVPPDLKGKKSGTTLGIILPLVYQLDKWNVGGQIQVGGNGLILKAPGGTEIKSTIDTAYQLVAGYNFDL